MCLFNLEFPGSLRAPFEAITPRAKHDFLLGRYGSASNHVTTQSVRRVILMTGES